MPDAALDIGEDLAGIALVPAPVEVLGDDPELDDEVAGKVLRLDLAALLPPQPHQGGLVIAHDDPGVRAADEVAAVGTFRPRTHSTLPAIASAAPWMVPVTSDARSESRASI